jgi:hypothetical protein
VHVYQILHWDRSVPPVTGMTGKAMATLIDAFLQVIEDWALDVAHVNKRLLAIYAGAPDPGALLENRLARSRDEKVAPR